MVPSTWLAVLLFMLFVSPGVLFDLLAARRRASPGESTFREIGRVVFASVGFSTVSILILVGVRAAVPAVVPDPRLLLAGGATYFADHYVAVLILVVAELVLAHGMALLLHTFFVRRDGGATIRSISTWSSAFKAEVPKDNAVYARIRLADGLVYSGQVLHFTADLPLGDREITLTRPLFSKTGTNNISPLPDDYQCVIIRGSEIVTMAVEYRPLNTKPALPASSGEVVQGAVAPQSGASAATTASNGQPAPTSSSGQANNNSGVRKHLGWRRTKVITMKAGLRLALFLHLDD